MSLGRLVIFLSVVLAVVGGVHLYFWQRLVRATHLPGPWRAVATAACVLLALSLPLTFLLVRRLPPTPARIAAWIGFGWLGFMFLLFVLLLLGDVARLFLGAWARLSGAATLDPERRRLLARAFGGAAGAGTLLLGATAVQGASRAPAVVEVPVRLRRLPRSRAGTTIAQLTDVHVGPTIGRAFIEDLVRRTNALEPDIVAITGDLVDGTVEVLAHAVAPLGDLRAKHGVYFVTGNHEYFSGAAPWIRELQRLGIRVLQNERVTIGEGSDAFDLAGVNDYNAGRLSGQAPDLARALAGRDPSRELILLAHQPREITRAAQHGVGLQLSGHTHAGQIWPFSYLVKLQQPYVAGLHTHPGSDTQIYVSPGTGYWGPPMRLGTRSEITKIILQPGSSPGVQSE